MDSRAAAQGGPQRRPRSRHHSGPPNLPRPLTAAQSAARHRRRSSRRPRDRVQQRHHRAPRVGRVGPLAQADEPIDELLDASLVASVATSAIPASATLVVKTHADAVQSGQPVIQPRLSCRPDGRRRRWAHAPGLSVVECPPHAIPVRRRPPLTPRQRSDPLVAVPQRDSAVDPRGKNGL
jgi:hypothetical protein